MPFRLSNSPSVFQAFLNDIFRDMLNQWVIVHIDDILIYSETYEEHVRHIRAVLKRLLQHQLYAKAEKCEFHQETISFLGYLISSGVVTMDEQKVRAVVNWPQPTTLKELQRFLGFVNFYRRFIRNFNTIAAPMMSMIKVGNPTSQLVFGSNSSIPVTQGEIHDRSYLASSRQRSRIQCGSRCFQYRHWGSALTRPGWSSQTIPLCILLPQTEPDRAELWNWQPWTPCYEGSIRGVASLAGRGKKLSHGSHWPP